MSKWLTILTDRRIHLGRFLIFVRSGHWGDGEIVTHVQVRDLDFNRTVTFSDGVQSEADAIGKVLAELREYDRGIQSVISALEELKEGDR